MMMMMMLQWVYPPTFQRSQPVLHLFLQKVRQLLEVVLLHVRARHPRAYLVTFIYSQHLDRLHLALRIPLIQGVGPRVLSDYEHR
jgi:hypothetical protein